MKPIERRSLAAIPLILLLGAALSWAGSRSGLVAGGTPVFVICAALCFAINWAVFVPAYVLQTERYFDLTGTATYVSVVVVALALGRTDDPRAWLLGALVIVWSVRLGAFLFTRISKDGSDGRFDPIKPSFPRFLMTWTLQGLWVLVTLGCALAAMTSSASRPMGGFALLGALLFGAGFVIEVMADGQKRRFRADPANRDRFITSGLWSWSRHPNYFGEVLLWVGVAVVALPALSGWQYVTAISPLFVYLLLTRISGIPMLEARARKRWGNEPEYQAYTARTPALVPRPPRTA